MLSVRCGRTDLVAGQVLHCPCHCQLYLNSFASYFCRSGLQTCSKCMLVCAGPSAGPLASAGADDVLFFISACLPTPQMYLNSFPSYFCISGLQTCRKCILVCASPSAGPLASAGANDVLFFISACPPTPQMYLNSFASYFCISGLQTCAKCMLVCAGPIAGPLAGAGADGLSFFHFCLSMHATDVFKFFCQLFLHKWASNLLQMSGSMCWSKCQSIGQCRCLRVIFLFLPVCPHHSCI